MSSRRWDILLHEARGQLRGRWMQNIDNAIIDHQSHRGDSERLWVGLGGHRSVSTPLVVWAGKSSSLRPRRRVSVSNFSVRVMSGNDY